MLSIQIPNTPLLIMVRDVLQSLCDAFSNGETSTTCHGKRVILPASFTGSARYFYNRFQDGMAIVRRYGKPDLFITMTCNPQWSEIQRELAPGEKAEDRPDIVARVFNSKHKKFMKAITEQQIFGEVEAHMHVIEFQKRGMPS